MRLFVAADLHEWALTELRQETARMKEHLTQDFIRWIPEAHWHLTLAFLDERPEEDLPRIQAVIAGAIPADASAELHPRSMKLYPHRAQPRLLALQVHMWTNVLSGISSQIAEELSLSERQGRFNPHITLARFKEPEGKGLYDQVWSWQTEFFRNIWPVPSVSLFESKLQAGGSEYRRLATWPLVNKTVDWLA